MSTDELAIQRFLKACRYYFGYAFFFSMFVNILQLTFSIYMLQVYDKVLTSYNFSTLVVITVAAIISLVVLALLEWLRSRLLVRAGIEFDSILSLPTFLENIKNINNPSVSEVLGTPKDVQVIRNFLGGSSVFAFFDAPWMPIYFILIFILHPALGVTSLCGGAVVFFIGFITERITRKSLGTATKYNNKSSSFHYASIRNADIINSMGMRSSMANRWKKLNDVVIEMQTRASKKAGLLLAISKSLRIGLQVLIYAVGAYLTIMQESSAGIMIAASIVMGRALAPIDLAMSTYKQSLEARAAYFKLKKIMDMPQAGILMYLPAPKGTVSLENLFFTMQGRDLIKGITLNLPAGQSLALIGPSAAGKSTLCKLILGILPASSGKVRIDAADIATWDSEKLGRYLGYLPQDVELFSGTIAENVARMGEVDSEKVIQAARLAGVHELILKLSNGYNTRVGEQSLALSGGQKQRIGLARALYGFPKILILDEPNSNLDEEGEAHLMQTIALLKKMSCTIIIVTHKKNILFAVDNIIILHEGRVSLSGERTVVLKKLAEANRIRTA